MKHNQTNRLVYNKHSVEQDDSTYGLAYGVVEHSLDSAENWVRFRSSGSFGTVIKEFIDRVTLVKDCVLNVSDRIRSKFVELIDLLTKKEMKEGRDDTSPSKIGETSVDDYR